MGSAASGAPAAARSSCRVAAAACRRACFFAFFADFCFAAPAAERCPRRPPSEVAGAPARPLGAGGDAGGGGNGAAGGGGNGAAGGSGDGAAAATVVG